MEAAKKKKMEAAYVYLENKLDYVEQESKANCHSVPNQKLPQAISFLESDIREILLELSKIYCFFS